MSEIVKDLKALALELDRPIVVLSQISRAPEYREDHRPILSDFYASDAVIQYADVFSQMSFHSLLYAIMHNSDKRYACTA